MYSAALFADFFAPYGYDDEQRLLSYCPPARIHLFDGRGRFRGPFIYGLKISLGRYRRKVYSEDRSRIYPLRLFARRKAYRFLGIWRWDRCLLGLSGDVFPAGPSQGLAGGGRRKEARLFLWGADLRGRDIFSRIIYGARISLTVGLIGVAISFAIGLFLGGVAGFYGGRVDNLIMRACEMVMMIPGFYVMLALRAAFPANLSSGQVYVLIVVIFSFIGWAGLARVIRGMSISLREREYVLAARALGVPDAAIILRHILPHCLSYAVVAATLSVPSYILAEAGLSFLGLGVQDPVPSWGNMLSQAMGVAQISFYPWLLLPGAFIFLTVSSFNLLGDGLRGRG
ncbi:MAG: ABC transporter permease [Candidatus Omnitrophota bacterium]